MIKDDKCARRARIFVGKIAIRSMKIMILPLTSKVKTFRRGAFLAIGDSQVNGTLNWRNIPISLRTRPGTLPGRRECNRLFTTV
jgi:hypothetical protein